jgi:hypothetical protein
MLLIVDPHNKTQNMGYGRDVHCSSTIDHSYLWVGGNKQTMTCNYMVVDRKHHGNTTDACTAEA